MRRRQCPGVDAEPPGQVRDARRGVQPDRVAGPPTEPQRRRHPQPDVGAGQVPAQPEHVVATAGARCGRPGRRGHQPRLRRTRRPGRARARSSAASGPARSRRPRSLYASTAVRSGPRYRPAATTGGPPGSIGHRGGPSRAAQPAHHPGPGAAQPPQEPGRTRSSRAASRTRGDSGGEASEEVGMRRACRTGTTEPGRQPTGTAELSTSRGRRPQARAQQGEGRGVSRGRAAPRPARRPSVGARTRGPRPRSSTPRTGPSPARDGSARRRPRAAAA